MNIDTGFVNEALVDLTGGISEIVRVEEYSDKPKALFKLMSRMMEMSSFMGCAVNVIVFFTSITTRDITTTTTTTATSTTTT